MRIEAYTKYKCPKCNTLNWTFDCELEKQVFVGFRCWKCKAETVDSEIDPFDLQWAEKNDEYDFQQGHECEDEKSSFRNDRSWKVLALDNRLGYEKIVDGDEALFDWIKENINAFEMKIICISKQNGDNNGCI